MCYEVMICKSPYIIKNTLYKMNISKHLRFLWVRLHTEQTLHGGPMCSKSNFKDLDYSITHVFGLKRIVKIGVRIEKICPLCIDVTRTNSGKIFNCKKLLKLVCGGLFNNPKCFR